VGLLLVGGGIAALLGEPQATWMIALAFPVAIALGVVCVAMASTEWLKIAISMALGLPFLLFVYILALGVIVQYAPAGGSLLVILGAGSLAMMLRPSRAARAVPIPSSAEPALR
jgi:hypothetical protein